MTSIESRTSFIAMKEQALAIGELGARYTDALHRENCFRWIRHGAIEALFAGIFFEKFKDEMPPGITLADIQLAFLLHDFGKSDSIEHPGVWGLSRPKLKADELENMQKHVEVGLAKLFSFESDYYVYFPSAVYDVMEHHEKLNGSGKPFGLKGRQISYLGRFAAVVDQIISRVENREYHERTFTLQEAFDDVNSQRGKLYDPQILDKVGEIFQSNLHMQEPGLVWLGEY